MDIENNNHEGIRVKEEIEDASYHESNIEAANLDVKQECKQEIKEDCSVENEHYISYDENVTRLMKVEINSTIHYRRKLYQCPKCSVQTKYESNLNKHISFMHPENKSVQAGNKQVYNKERLLNGHELNYQRPLFEFNCDQCPFRCNVKFEFVYHVYEYHYKNLQNEKFECPYCFKHYYLDHKLKTHLVDCRKANYLQCDDCSGYFRGKGSIREHIRRKHFKVEVERDNLNQRLFKSCPKCGKKYKYSMGLSQHFDTCGKDDLFKCGTCLHTTNNKYSLAHHILLHLKKRNLCLNVTYYRRKPKRC